jgi:hypothetical protein
MAFFTFTAAYNDSTEIVGTSCGGFASVPLNGPEYQGARVALERLLFDERMGHCDYSMARACLDWESGGPDAGRRGFQLAQSFCDDKSVAERGEVASALVRQDYGEAFAAWKRNVSLRPEDSILLSDYEPAIFTGLSTTGYSYRGPDIYRLPLGNPDPNLAWRLSAIPGLSLLYVGEPQAAIGHFLLSTGFAAVCGYSAWRGFRARNQDARMVAWMDFGLVATLFLQRYYLGGIREAHRLAQVKNRRNQVRKAMALTETLNPFHR